MKVLLSIKPEFVEQIFSGKKRFEYRKAIFKNPDVTTIIIYSTKPVGKIVGEFEIADVLCDAPSKIWNKTKQFSGVEESFYNQYYNGKDKAYAIQITSLKKYINPICPYENFDNFTAPQSFMYLKQNNYLKIRVAT